MAPSSYRESLRLSYKPEEVRVLFVGESPPAGGTFFYQSNSLLYRYTKEAFSQALVIEQHMDFLHTFSNFGCYLIDLCHTPVNNLDTAERITARRNAVPGLIARLNQLGPRAVISTPKSICPQVLDALSDSTLDTPHWSVPFPSMGHQLRYRSELADVLRDLSIRGDLNAELS